MSAAARPVGRIRGQPGSVERVSNGMPAFAWRAFSVLAILTSLTLAMVVGGNVYGSRLVAAGLSTSPAPLRIVMGNDVLDVPANMIRRPEQRSAGITDRIDLAVHWPDRSGFRTELVPAFSDTDPETARIVLASLAPRRSFLDMAARLDPVYRNALAPRTAWRNAFGLHVAPLRADLGYVEEVLVFSPAAAAREPAFIARCHGGTPRAQPLLLACEVDLHVGQSLEARIRFPAGFLADWRRFGPELDAFLDDLFADDRAP